MNSTATDRGTIQIEVPSPLFVVRILDSQLWEVASTANGQLEHELPAGLYIARCEMGGPAIQKTFKVVAGKPSTVSFSDSCIDNVRIPSAAPVSGAVNNHEYYSEHVRDLSLAAKADAVWKNGQARLIVMNRSMVDVMLPTPPVSLKGFRLHTVNGEEVSRFILRGSSGVLIRRRVENRQFKRFAFSIDLPPGGYLLTWPAGFGPKGQRVCMPVWISAKCTTGVFLGVNPEDRFPSPDLVSVQLGARRNEGGFDRGDYRSKNTMDLLGAAAELALASLKTGRRQMSDTMLDMLLEDKFRNPMSGIVGAYMLCQRSNPNWKLFQKVFGRLQDLLGRDHPELAGLAALARQSGWKHMADFPPSTFPPMLRVGLSALAGQEWQKGGLRIVPGSLTELANMAAWSNSVWSMLTMPASALERKPGTACPISRGQAKAASPVQTTRSFLTRQISAVVSASQSQLSKWLMRKSRIWSSVSVLAKVPTESQDAAIRAGIRQMQREGLTRSTVEQTLQTGLYIGKGKKPLQSARMRKGSKKTIRRKSISKSKSSAINLPETPMLKELLKW